MSGEASTSAAGAAAGAAATGADTPDLGQRLSSLEQQMSAFLNFQRQTMGIAPDASLTTASDWRAARAVPAGTPPSVEPERRPGDPEPRRMEEERHRRPEDDGRRAREPTYTSSATRTSSSGRRKIKREEVGIFDPEYPDPQDVGMVTVGKDLIYTDVWAFWDRLDTFLDNESTRENMEVQIVDMFSTLLQGSAVYWWTNELPADQRRRLRNDGLNAMMEALEVRFAMDPGRATKKFREAQFRLRDLLDDEYGLRKFIQKKIRYARAMGTLDRYNDNWRGVLTDIWTGMELDIQQYLAPPRRGQTMEKYMQTVEESKTLLLAAADRKNPFYRPKPRDRDDRAGRYDSRYASNRDDNRGHARYDDRYRRDNRYDDDRRDFKRDRDRPRQDDRPRQFRDAGRRQDDRPRERYAERDRSRDRGGGRDRDRERGRDRGRGRDRDRRRHDGANNVLSDHEADNRQDCEDSDASRMSSRSPSRDPSPASSEVGLLTHPNAHPARRTCVHCDLECESRNLLFKHLKTCQPPAKMTRRGVESEMRRRETAHLVVEPIRYSEADVVQAPAPPKFDAVAMGGYTHLQIKVRATIDGGDVHLCADSGSGKSLVDRRWLDKHFPERRVVTAPTPDSVKGVGGRPFSLTERAVWDIYAPGKKDDGTHGLLRETAEAWIVDELDAGCLLGNDWIMPRNAAILSKPGVLAFPNSHFNVPFVARKTAARPVVRKVTTRRAIRISPKQTVQVAVEYVDLPKGRSFMFTAQHPTAMNALVDAATPHIIQLHNPSTAVVKVPKGTRMGTISECEDNAYFVANWSSVVEALTYATTMGTSLVAQPTEAAVGGHDVDFSTTGTLTESPISAMGAEFELSPYVVELASGRAQTPALGVEVDACGLVNAMLASDTPVSDAVADVVANAPLGASLAPEIVIDPPDVPRTRDVWTSFNIKTPDNVPVLKTAHGVTVNAVDRAKAIKLQRICEAYPTLWEDRGPVTMDKADMMQVPLVDGWQTAKLNRHRYPVSKRDEACIDEVFDHLHATDRMEWPSGSEVSPFALPVFVVRRTVHGQDKGRPVVDLRPVNKVAVPDSYPLPLQADVMASIHGKRWLTVIDATKFFYQLLVHPAFRDRFTFITHRGLERSKVAPMGFRNSPAYAQRFMDRLLKPYRDFCRAFIDDVVIFSDSFEDHQKHLHAIFGLFTDRGLSMSPSKSCVGFQSVELLGFYVDAFGMTTTKERTQGFRDLEFPDKLKNLETYLGAAGFLRPLIPYFAQLAEPLQRLKTKLLAEGRTSGRFDNGNRGKRQHFVETTRLDPTPLERESFNALQDYLTTKLRLAHMDPDKPLFLQIDGSLQHGFGVMMFHLKDDREWSRHDHIPATAIDPVLFLSRCLTKAELNYGPSELEVACLVWACKRLRTTIVSNRHPIVVLTDHESTMGIVNRSTLNTTSTDRANRRLINAAIYLDQYHLDVVHLPGRLNLVPDALSRLSKPGDVDERQRDEVPVLDQVFDHVPNFCLSTAEAVMADDLRLRFEKAYSTSYVWRPIIADLKGDDGDVVSAQKPGHPFRLVDRLLYNRDAAGRERLVVPPSLVTQFLEEAHGPHHFGRDRMMATLDGLHFRRKRRLVDEYLRTCLRCGELRKDNQKPIGDLQPIQPPEEPMHTIAVDFVVGLPPVSAVDTPWQLGHDVFDALLTVTDKTSKRTLLIPGNNKYTAENWASVLVRQLLLSDWSCPQTIISDRDAKFTSAFWKGLWKGFGTKLAMTTAYHPQADGQSERKNQSVELALRYYVAEFMDEWINVVPALQWNLNNAYSRTIDASPHEFLFGFKLTAPVDRLTQTLPQKQTEIRFMRQHLRRDAQLTMDVVASENKRLYDQKHRRLDFDVGQKVWLKTGKAYQPLHRQGKLTPPRLGPFTIVQKISSLAYKLDFPPSSKVHPVVSVQYLLPCDTRDPFQRRQPPPRAVDYGSDTSAGSDVEHREVERILGKRLDRRGGRDTVQYLVRWKGLTARDDEWLHLSALKHCQQLIDEFEVKQGEGAPRRSTRPVKPSAKATVVRREPRKQPQKKPRAKMVSPTEIQDEIVVR